MQLKLEVEFTSLTTGMHKLEWGRVLIGGRSSRISHLQLGVSPEWLWEIRGLQPAPRPHLGPGLDQEHGKLPDNVTVVVIVVVVFVSAPIVVVHCPEESVPQGDVLILQVGAMCHQLTRNPLSTFLK